jgi:hypothetical protein
MVKKWCFRKVFSWKWVCGMGHLNYIIFKLLEIVKRLFKTIYL